MLGAPGSGKGTQTKLLESRFDAAQLSTGDLLRTAVAEGTETGLRVKAALDAGELVPDEIVLEQIRERLTGETAPRSFILDGFPRNTVQAQALEELLADIRKPLDAVIQIEVPSEALWKRISGRRSCRDCGAVYNVYTAASKVAGKCDRCGGETYQRDDDNEATVQNRLRTYEEQTAPVISFYAKKGLLFQIDGDAPTDVVFERIVDHLDAITA
ncbi:MAG: adenylate kinase [Pseudomonadota bacterium]|nr:adenylate kinase [Pseudomonadota bacterium]